MQEGLRSAEVQSEQEKNISLFKRIKVQYESFREIASILSKDEALKEGTEALFRTVINSCIAIADTVPGIGDLASWGADAAKVWARWEHQKAVALKGNDYIAQGMSIEEAEEKAKSEIKISKIDLSPDVSVAVAVGSEALELVGLGTVPTHAIETLGQLRYDWKKIINGMKRTKEVFIEQRKVGHEVQEAAEIFDVNFE